MPSSFIASVCLPVNKDEDCGDVVFASSDAAHELVMQYAAMALAAGADFILLGPRHTMLKAARPVIAISAVRTGCGKSQTSRAVAGWLRAAGLKVVVIRDTMALHDCRAQLRDAVRQ